MPMTTKAQIISFLDRLPDDASIQQAIDELYLLSKIERGLAQADAGDVISHEEMRRKFLGDSTPNGKDRLDT